MIKFSIEFFSKFQILLGINYHSGVEVFENELNEETHLDFHGIEIGLIFFVIDITFYKPHVKEEQ